MTKSFEEWLAELPKWLQTAAAEYLTSGSMPNNAELPAFADLAMKEALEASAEFVSVKAGSFDEAQTWPSLKLQRIEALVGINALDSNAKLDFKNADLGVVYGHNGTGKSGFARLLKHAAGSRARSALLTNVFSEQEATQQADFVLDSDGSCGTHTWNATAGALEALQHVQIFDTDVARQYMTGKAEARYEPRRLRFLSELVDICERVKTELTRRREGMPSSLPNIPTDLGASPLGIELAGLTPKAKPDVLKAKWLS